MKQVYISPTVNRYMLIAVTVYLAFFIGHTFLVRFTFSTLASFGPVPDQFYIVFETIMGFMRNAGFVYWLWAEKADKAWIVASILFGLPAILLFYLFKNIKQNSQ